jgi:hypothetical protein
MKRCENCKKNYSDAVNFCTECGRILITVPDSGKYETVDNISMRNRKKRPLWKIVLITLGVLFAIFCFLLNSVMDAATYLRVEPSMLVADKSGGEINVNIDYDGYVWTINHFPDWVEIEEYEQSFSVKAANNMSGRNREGSITVQSGDFLAQVVIQQRGQATFIKPSQYSIHFDEDGGTETITIETDGCNSKVDFPDFLLVTSCDNNIRIKALRNSSEYRSGYVTIKEDNITTRIHITQGGLCNNCHATGSITCAQCAGLGGWGYGMFYSQCWMCGGNGTLQCATCKGSGERE